MRITLILVLWLATISFSDENLLVPTVRSSFISNAIHAIVHRFFVNETTTISISSGMSRINYQHNEILNELIHELNGCVLYRIETRIDVENRFIRKYNIILIDGYKGFRLIFDQIPNAAFNHAGYFMIVMTSREFNPLDILKILQDCWSLYITNVVILVSIGPVKQTVIYSYFPYTQHSCEHVEVAILDYYVVNEFLRKIDLFPNKMNNLHKCPITVATFKFVPHMFLTKNPDGSYYMDGIDGIIMRVIAQQLNFTAIVKVPSNGEMRGEILPNGTMTGSMYMLKNGLANLSIGGIGYSASRVKFFEPSMPYYYSSVVFAVPRGKPYSGINKLLFPFSNKMWMYIGVLFLSATVLICILKMVNHNIRDFVVGRGNHMPFFNMVNGLLGGTIMTVSNRNFARTMLIIWISAALVLRNAYQGYLFYFLRRVNIIAPPSTIDDVAKQNYTIYMSASTLNIFESIPKIRQQTKVYVQKSNYLMALMDSSLRAVYIASAAVIAYFNKVHFRSGLFIQPPTQRIFLLPLSIYLTKHSCLLSAINEQIEIFINSGLAENWSAQFVEESYLSNIINDATLKEPHQLVYEQLEGAFQLCVCLMVISFGVFLLELLSVKIKSIRNVLDAIT